MKLAGKVAIVTGGASGIGEETARRFAKQGARAVVIADVQDELGREVASSICRPITKSVYVHCDVTQEDQVKSLVHSTVAAFGQLDVMFSNAGIATSSPSSALPSLSSSGPAQTVLGLDLEAMDRVLAVNVRGTAACVKHAARAMVEGRVRGGSIVCTASVAGSTGGRGMVDYYLSKHAVVGLVRSASVQLGEHGIRVNCVSPYVVATPMALRGFGGEKDAEWVESTVGVNMSLKGVALRAGHVADAVVFLASAESELVTGLDLVVDGGYKGHRR
ncbi:unnamed protein product [Linum tenue]|uniref:Uncharacterized protein n=1 Tax=Linum tenue TaxID=586396 RepID=A0AAV0INS8_9ROSI|nr:unnamed protein product [Linum tenue]